MGLKEIGGLLPLDTGLSYLRRVETASEYADIPIYIYTYICVHIFLCINTSTL